jgi:transglutaminase-like putative cysteine protease
VSTLPVHELNTSANELNLGSAKVYHLPDWHKLSHPERLGVMRQIAKMRGRDPRIAKLALSIIRRSGAKPRQYEKQASALLKWVQNPKNCYYINEPGERLQDPIYTIKVKHGDCDDMVLLLCCLFEAVNLPWKQVLSGQGPKGKIRYIEGERVPSGVAWTAGRSPGLGRHQWGPPLLAGDGQAQARRPAGRHAKSVCTPVPPPSEDARDEE